MDWCITWRRKGAIDYECEEHKNSTTAFHKFIDLIKDDSIVFIRVDEGDEVVFTQRAE